MPISDSLRATVLVRAAELSALRIAPDLESSTRDALARSVDFAFLIAYRQALMLAAAAAFIAAFLGAAFTAHRSPAAGRP